MLIKDFQNKIKEFELKISEAEKIFIIPHINADGDAIGSVLSLYIVLKNAGKNPRVISPGNYPGFLKWMPDNDIIEVFNKKDKDVLSDADLIIAMDFNALSRLGNMSENYINSKAYKILIDHHPEPENLSDLVFSDISYSSTAEFIYDILINSKFEKHINKDCATCIYTGIMTDTGCFSFNSSNPRTFKVVAELLKKGIDKNMIFSKIYDEFSFNRMKLLGHALLNGMTFLPEYKTAYIVISAKDRKNFKEEIGDTENFVNYPLSISGCIFSAIFIEREKFIKISFRSKGDFSAGEFAKKHFNGGGHKNASGGETNTSLEESVKKFVKLLSNYKEQLNRRL